jgi:translocation protein SEC63
MKKRANLYRFTWVNTWFLVKFAILAVMWYGAYLCFDVVKEIKPLKTFIPHEILGVEADATVAQVKKAYRQLSREKHPDKNPDNPEAVNEFITITKAYTIMTDDKARENFLKYGNPDGKGTMAVGIALPNFLQKKEYQIQVLVAFFIIIIIIIPGYFYNKIMSNEKDVGGVDIDNRKIFTELIPENMLGKQIPGILAHSFEFS